MSIFSYAVYALKETAYILGANAVVAVLNPTRIGVVAFQLAWRESYRVIESCIKPVFDQIRAQRSVSSHLQEKVTDLVHFTTGCAVAYAFYGNDRACFLISGILVVENAIRRHFGYVSTTMRHMTVEDKVGQLLMAHFNGETLNEEALVLVREVKVGGIIYYATNGLQKKDQVMRLSELLQLETRIKKSPELLIAVDQEGGIVSRLGEEFPQFPGNGALTDPELAKQAALAMGIEMRDVGVNMNLAPCVDVNSNPKNPVIGLRAYSDNPRIVTQFAGRAVTGYQKSGVIPVLKHFPGHGDTSQDSHVELPVVPKSLYDLKMCDLFPFAALAKKVDCIMTAHIKTALDLDNCATLSERTLRYLRNNLGFEGMIITDSLVMGAIEDVDRAAIRALNAGCDMLLLGGRTLIGNTPHELRAADVLRVKNSIVKAVRDKEIPMSRIDDAVRRILTLKLRRLHHVRSTFFETHFLYPANPPKMQPGKSQALSREIATKAIRVVRGSIPMITKSNAVLYAPEMLHAHIEKYSHISARYYDEPAIKKCKSIIVIFSYNAWKAPGQQELIRSAIFKNKRIVLVVTGYPNDAALFPEVATVIHTYGSNGPSIQAVCDVLRKGSNDT
jgi:beta-N-acetylhexosaminidase